MRTGWDNITKSPKCIQSDSEDLHPTWK